MNILLSLFFLFACFDKSKPNDVAETNNIEEKTETTASGERPFTPTPPTVVADIGVQTDATNRVSGDIISRHKKIGNNPGDAIALWIEAAIRAQNGEEQGWKALGALTLDSYTGKPLSNDPNWRKTISSYFLRPINENNPCFRSLVVGAIPENNYKVDVNNIKVLITKNGTRNSTGNKYFIKSSGALDRPFALKQSNKTGLLYISEYSSLYVDVRKPIDPDEETFE